MIAAQRSPLLGPAGGATLGGAAAVAAVLAAALLVPPSRAPLPAAERASVAAASNTSAPPPPPVEPVDYLPVAPSDAVALNAAVPFSTAPNPAARPFRFRGDDEARGRAVDCLASAMLYEAGTEGEEGQRAVGQVVLNRVRHPAFPNSICGVVYQGSERRTGCQFTFTCDGALARMPAASAWDRSRRYARQAIEGRVFARVGQATHYHTNWVLPYWSGTLDKIVAVGTHLFFRWTGWWGTPPAFADRHAGTEPAVAALARLSDVHRTAEATMQAEADPDVAPVAAMAQRPMLLAETVAPLTLRSPGAVQPPRLAADAAQPRLLAPGEDSFIFLLDANAPDGFPAIARRACGDRPYCKVQGWTDRAQVPAGYPVPADRLASMAFSYLRDRSEGFDKMLWNCRQFPRTDRGQCMRG